MAMRLRAAQRLRRNADFRATREQGYWHDSRAFLLVWRQSHTTSTRVGVVASCASIGNAVRRVRAKRLLRELFRQHQALVPTGVDVVLTARPTLLQLEFAELETLFAASCRKFAAHDHRCLS